MRHALCGLQVRVSCAEQLLSMCAWGGGGGARAALEALGGAVACAGGAAAAGGAGGARLQRHARHAQQFLQLLCRLVSLAGPTARTLEDLAVEVIIQILLLLCGNYKGVRQHIQPVLKCFLFILCVICC